MKWNCLFSGGVFTDVCDGSLTGKMAAAVPSSSRAWWWVCGMSDALIHWTTSSTLNLSSSRTSREETTSRKRVLSLDEGPERLHITLQQYLMFPLWWTCSPSADLPGPTAPPSGDSLWQTLSRQLSSSCFVYSMLVWSPEHGSRLLQQTPDRRSVCFYRVRRSDKRGPQSPGSSGKNNI